MAVKKIKISATKRANHLKGKRKISKTPKPAKENSLLKNSLQVPRRVKKKEKPKKAVPVNNNQQSDNEEELFESIRDIIDEEDYISFDGTTIKKSRKRKLNDTIQVNESLGLESEYASQQFQEKKSKKFVVDLLPIKSKHGEIITRSTEVDYKPKLTKDDENIDGDEDDEDHDENAVVEDSDEDILEDVPNPEESKDNDTKRIISTTDLLIQRQQELDRQKYRIGIICSGILEKPEDKMKNFGALFELLEEYNKNGVRNLFSVRKLSLISITEIFKDILPEYRVGQVDTKMTKVRKTTLERITYETALLQQFKKFLQKSEKLVACISNKGGPRKTPENMKLAEITVECLCDILLAHPYFNYVKNVGQLLVYLLNSRYHSVREKVNECFKGLFKTDQKLEMSLYIIRRINHLIKKKSNNVYHEMVSCLLALNIKDVNLDAEKEKELKEKKLEAKRQRLINMSKKERKRMKKLKEVNRELEETRAEENKQTKLYKLTEITKMVFTIYFRILKNDPNSKLLSCVLEGLAQFAHVINIDFFSDLIEILNGLLESDGLGYREQLHCIQTIFVILSGQGEILNIDPIRFYVHLYRNLLVVHAGKNHEDFLIILRTLHEVLTKRKSNISQLRLFAFVKRLIMISMHLLHNGTLASLGVIKTIMQITNNLEILLDTDSTLGSGRYDPELNDPEYCNSKCTSLYELAMLQRHYHPTVRQMAMHVAYGVPTSGDGSLPPEVGKLTSDQLFTQYDSCKVSFNPQIPVPKASEPKIKKGRFTYLDSNLENHVNELLKCPPKSSKMIDFRPIFQHVFKKKFNNIQ